VRIKVKSVKWWETVDIIRDGNAVVIQVIARR